MPGRNGSHALSDLYSNMQGDIGRRPAGNAGATRWLIMERHGPLMVFFPRSVE